VTNTIL